MSNLRCIKCGTVQREDQLRKGTELTGLKLSERTWATRQCSGKKLSGNRCNSIVFITNEAKK